MESRSKNQSIQALVYLLIFCAKNCTSDLANCSNSSGVIRPSVELGRTLRIATSIEKTLFINVFVGSNRYYLTCSHPTHPVLWEFNVPQDGIVDIIVSAYWRESSSSKYFAHFGVIPNAVYKDEKNLLPLLFTCRTAPHHYSSVNGSYPCSHRSYIFNKSRTLFLVQDDLLMPQKLPNPSFNLSFTAECDLILRYRINGTGNLEYSLETPKGQVVKSTITKTASPEYFKALYASESQMSHCVKRLLQNETCSTCKLVGRRAGNEILTGVIFYAKKPEMERPFVVKGIFEVISDANDQREFYWQWELSPDKMIKIDAPSVFFVNKTETVNCTVSAMIFAIGASLNLKSYEDQNKTLFKDSSEILEIYNTNFQTIKEHGLRQLTRQFTFYEEVESDSIICMAPLIDFSQNVSKLYNIRVLNPEEAQIVETSLPTGIQTLDSGDSVELKCVARGKPRPTIDWTFPIETGLLEILVAHNLSSDWEVISTAFISNFQSVHEGAYNCKASNYLNSAVASFSLQLPQGLSTGQKAGLGAGFGSILVVFVLILGAIYAKIILQRRKFLRETMRVKGEFFKGIPGDKQKLFELEENEGIVATIESQPFDKSSEVPYEDWTIGDEILGKGNFGLVRKGYVKLPHVKEPVEVAVKTLLNVSEIDEFKRFLYELKLMKCIGSHPNIVCLVASCVENIDQRDVLIGVELCSLGCLLDYLQNNSSKLKQYDTKEKEPSQEAVVNNSNNLYQNGPSVGYTFADFEDSDDEDLALDSTYKKLPSCRYVNLDDETDLKCNKMTSPYQNEPTVIHSKGVVGDSKSSESNLTDTDLYVWSLEISKGMEFLASKKLLHGDLAARNILLTSSKTAKISDFGLSRHLDENSTYKKKSRVAVPWKYLAIECLTSHVFSQASDVWAFGITMWEIFTLGQVPYAGSCMGHDFIALLDSGMRLPKPARAPGFMYELMNQCWLENPRDRPTFSNLKHQLTYFIQQLHIPPNQHLEMPNTPSMVLRRSTQDNTNNDHHERNPQNTQEYSNLPRLGNLYINS